MNDFALKTLWNKAQERNHFTAELETGLLRLGYEFISSSFGRGPNMIGLWTIFVREGSGPAQHQIIRLPSDTLPYSKEAIEAVLRQFQRAPNEAAG